MKAILIIDEPESCAECPLSRIHSRTYETYCSMARDESVECTCERAPFCPLKIPSPGDMFVMDGEEFRRVGNVYGRSAADGSN